MKQYKKENYKNILKGKIKKYIKRKDDKNEK